MEGEYTGVMVGIDRICGNRGSFGKYWGKSGFHKNAISLLSVLIVVTGCETTSIPANRQASAVDPIPEASVAAIKPAAASTPPERDIAAQDAENASAVAAAVQAQDNLTAAIAAAVQAQDKLSAAIDAAIQARESLAAQEAASLHGASEAAAEAAAQERAAAEAAAVSAAAATAAAAAAPPKTKTFGSSSSTGSVTFRGSEMGNALTTTFGASSGMVGRNIYVPIYLYMPLPSKVGDSIYRNIVAKETFRTFYRQSGSDWLLNSQVPMAQRGQFWNMLEAAGFDASTADFKAGRKLSPVVLEFAVGPVVKNRSELVDVRLVSSSGSSEIDEAVIYGFRQASFFNKTGKAVWGKFVYGF
jgi:hypothetical protein